VSAYESRTDCCVVARGQCPAYAEMHELLQGHPTSQRLSGALSETVVSVDHLGFAGVDFPRTPIAIIPDTDLPPASIAGGVGLPLLSHFRLIIDYSHSRLYAVPITGAAKTTLAKDRIGLMLTKKDGEFGVAFVAPHSPADAAGFKKGDKITLIDGMPFDAGSRLAILEFHLADVGTRHTFADRRCDESKRFWMTSQRFESRGLQHRSGASDPQGLLNPAALVGQSGIGPFAIGGGAEIPRCGVACGIRVGGIDGRAAVPYDTRR